jgi:hypothetical protein
VAVEVDVEDEDDGVLLKSEFLCSAVQFFGEKNDDDAGGKVEGGRNRRNGIARRVTACA